MRPQNFGLMSENLGRNMTFSKKVCLPENIPPDTQNPMQFWKPCRIFSVKGLKSFHLCPKMTKEVWFFLQKLISVRKLFWTVRMQFGQPCPKIFFKAGFFPPMSENGKKKITNFEKQNCFWFLRMFFWTGRKQFGHLLGKIPPKGQNNSLNVRRNWKTVICSKKFFSYSMFLWTNRK